MTVSLKHTFQSAKADGPDSTVIQPSDWNDEHTLLLAAGKVLGRDTSGDGAAMELPLAFDPTLQSMKPPSGTTAQRPATAVAGMFRYNTSTSQLELYARGAWSAVGGTAQVANTAPASPQEGDFWFNSATQQLLVYYNSAWVAPAATIGVQTFSGTGTQTAFTLGYDPGTKNNTNVFISGVYQEKSTYSLSGTTLTFSAAPPNGATIEIETIGQVMLNVPTDNSVTSAKIVASAVGTNELANSAVTSAKLATDAVTTGKIADGAVTFPKMDSTAIATQAQAEAGTVTNKLMTPLQTAQAIQFRTQQVMFLRETKASGVDSSVTLTAATWVKRLITAEVNQIDGASVASSVVTLPAGTYSFVGRARTSLSLNSVSLLRLRNTTAGTTIFAGMVSSEKDESGGQTGFSAPVVDGVFTLTGSTTLELQHYSLTTLIGGDAQGVGELEVYASLMIQKIA